MNILPIKLLAGTHADTGETGQGCFMNVIAYLNGEAQITDESTCVCVTIRPIAIFANDLANDEQRQRLLPFLLRAMGSATDDKTEVSRRLDLLIAFANKQAESAKYAEFAAKSAEYAEYAAKYAEFAAKSAKYAKSAEYARYAAEYAVETAKYAEYAKYAAKYATESAKYAVNYNGAKIIIFNDCIEYLDAALPKAEAINDVVIERAKKLYEMATI